MQYGTTLKRKAAVTPASACSNTDSTMQAGSIYRKCAECNKEEKLQRKESGSDSAMTAPSIVQDALNSSGGTSLDTNTRSFMESRFNYNFDDVKIHDHSLAAKSADSINALAYTSGNNIVFNTGQYDTSSEKGKRLLAHELTHVVQQSDTVQRQTAEDDPCSTDKLWGVWPVLKELWCTTKCKFSSDKDCEDKCRDTYSFWALLKKCRQEHPVPKEPAPDIWDQTE